MRRSALLGSPVLVLAVILIAGWSYADVIGPDCESCHGNTFTLTYFNVNAMPPEGLPETYRVVLTIDTKEFVAVGTGEWLGSVSIKVASKRDYLSVTSVDQPENWVTNLTFSAGFVTDTNFGPTKLYLPDDILTWVWQIDVAPGTLLTGPDEATVKATYMRIGPQGQIQQRKTAETITLSMAGQ